MVLEEVALFKDFDPAKGTMTPVSALIFPNSTATLGDKMFFWTYIDGNTTIKYLYYLSQTLTNLFRLLII